MDMFSSIFVVPSYFQSGDFNLDHFFGVRLERRSQPFLFHKFDTVL